MDVLAQKILRGPTQHLLCRAIDECGLAIGVDAVDPLARRVQDQLVLTLQFGEKRLRPFPFQKASAVKFSCLCDLGAFVEGIKIGEAEQKKTRLIRHAARTDFAAQLFPVPSGERHVPRPAFAPVIDLFDKDHEFRQRSAQKGREPQGLVRVWVNSEQRRRCRVEGHHLVLSGVENKRGLGKCGQQGIRLVSFVQHAGIIAAAIQNSLTKSRNLRFIVKYRYR